MQLLRYTFICRSFTESICCSHYCNIYAYVKFALQTMDIYMVLTVYKKDSSALSMLHGCSTSLMEVQAFLTTVILYIALTEEGRLLVVRSQALRLLLGSVLLGLFKSLDLS